ncbi:hypothetical protein SEA_IBANTIK_46 [Streptomyces phage Ibantik]|uniref:Lipoprotein n=1 Tax=Streptomyces phage Ibantik TaxID=2182397 RepID=A0A2U8UNW6_9CAUD|nr:hypothetical protein QEH36_gp046 [Streptomyces phage Ibantik]AWN05270.1 hypothetical protein SEA_IBANTIK_46 [Streptomyces phage Ibantik]
MYRKSVYTATAVVLLALGSVSCSSDEPAKPKVTASPSVKEVSPAADTPSGSSQKSTAPTREQGAAQYLKLVAPYNEAFEKCAKVMNPLLNSQASSPDDFPKVRAACKDIPEANRTFADDLSKAKWPAEAAEAVSALVDEVRTDQLAWQEVSEVKTHGDLFNPDHPLSEDGPAAGLVRAHLGLPPVEDLEE